jgi:hypothetical protein
VAFDLAAITPEYVPVGQRVHVKSLPGNSKYDPGRQG